MGFYLRKSVSIGPLRFNLSKSGIGVSAGVRGFRVGTSPRGNYVHMGRGGLYFRQTLSPSASREKPPSFDEPRSDGSVGEFVDIDSGDTASMTDSSSESLLAELHEKRRRLRAFPFVVCGGLLALIGIWSTSGPSPQFAASALGLAAVQRAVRGWDASRKTTVILYDLEPEAESAYGRLSEAFARLQSCQRKWHVPSDAQVRDRRYHAGASTLVNRVEIRLTVGAPPHVSANLDVPLLAAGRQTLAFYPDRLLVFESNGVGAIPYDALDAERSTTRFIENSSVPSDTEVVGKTWSYVNKGGGPDRRFKDNRELPICIYEELRLTSRTGLNELFQFSAPEAAADFVDAIDGIRSLVRTPRAQAQV